MGYFPNGDSLRAYEREWCDRCAHRTDACAVWEAHLLFAYDAVDRESFVLNHVIPRDGVENLKCEMFIDRSKVADNANDEKTLPIGGCGYAVLEFVKKS